MVAKDITKRPEVDERQRARVVSLLGRRNVRDIAAATGLTPDEVLRIKQDVVEGIDALSLDEHVAKAVYTLQDVAAKALDSFQSVEDQRSLAPLLQAATGAIKTQIQVLDKWRTQNQGNVDRLNNQRQEELVLLLKNAFGLFAGRVAEMHNLDEAELWTLFEEDMRIAAEEMENRNRE